jgi:hypothetical protein
MTNAADIIECPAPHDPLFAPPDGATLLSMRAVDGALVIAMHFPLPRAPVETRNQPLARPGHFLRAEAVVERGHVVGEGLLERRPRLAALSIFEEDRT